MNKNNALSHKLPKYSPNDNIWDKIENDLIESEKSENTFLDRKLPKYSAPEEIWDKIDVETQKTNYRIGNFFLIKTAAVILLLIGLGAVLQIVNNESRIYEIRIHEQVGKEDVVDKEKINIGFSNLLAENCTLQPEICTKSDFLELKKQFGQLEKEESHLKEQLELYNDNQLKGYLNKISNEKLKIEKYMLNMFMIN